MRVIHLGEAPSLLQSYLAEMRDKHAQRDPMRFRTHAARIGAIMAYEISKTLPFQDKTIDTPLQATAVQKLESQPVLCAVLRAGLALHQGFLDFFDQADNAFVSAFRRGGSRGAIEVDVEYLACPELSGRDVLLVDPMLATGESLLSVCEALREKGSPRSLHIAVIIASEKGIETVEAYFKDRGAVSLWVAAVDPTLDANSYIVPGLGDAGDLAYGKRV